MRYFSHDLLGGRHVHTHIFLSKIHDAMFSKEILPRRNSFQGRSLDSFLVCYLSLCVQELIIAMPDFSYLLPPHSCYWKHQHSHRGVSCGRPIASLLSAAGDTLEAVAGGVTGRPRWQAQAAPRLVVQETGAQDAGFGNSGIGIVSWNSKKKNFV